MLQKFRDQFTQLLPVQKFVLTIVIIGLVTLGVFSLARLFTPKAVDCSTVPKVDNADVIRMEDGKFNPDNLTVKVCDTILFLNLDSTEHRPKSSLFDAGHALAKFDYFQYQVTRTGKYSFNDYLHPEITGKIIVEKIK